MSNSNDVLVVAYLGAYLWAHYHEKSESDSFQRENIYSDTSANAQHGQLPYLFGGILSEWSHCDAEFFGGDRAIAVLVEHHKSLSEFVNFFRGELQQLLDEGATFR